MNFMDYKVRCERHHRCQFVIRIIIASIAKNNIKLFCYSFEWWKRKKEHSERRKKRIASLSMDQFLLNCQRWMSVKCENRDRISCEKKCLLVTLLYEKKSFPTWDHLELEMTIGVQPIGRFSIPYNSKYIAINSSK